MNNSVISVEERDMARIFLLVNVKAAEHRYVSRTLGGRKIS